MQLALRELQPDTLSVFSSKSLFVATLDLQDKDHALVLLSKMVQICFKNYCSEIPEKKRSELKQPSSFDPMGWKQIIK